MRTADSNEGHTPGANQLFVRAWWLHQRKQLIDCLFGDAAHTIGIERSCNSHLTNHGQDFVAEVRQEPQRVLGIIGHTRDQAGYQNLACDHSSVEFFHAALPLLLPSAR
jgi:hypothetical protein